ncbi:MAG: hypothetical protein L0922_07770 [Candidatus Mariimomonas ferrooxydans]
MTIPILPTRSIFLMESCRKLWRSHLVYSMKSGFSWEMSENIKPFDYQQPEQLPFLYEMHQVMEKEMTLCLVIPTPMTIDSKDLDIFLDYYPIWKEHRNIRFDVLDYGMTCSCAIAM